MIETKTGITAVRSVHFGVPDLEATTRFYEDKWGIKAISQTSDSVYFRATGSDFYVLALHRTATPTVLRTDFVVRTRDQVDALYASLQKAGIEVGSLGPIDEPGGGHGFMFKDPVDGRVFAAIADAQQHADSQDVADQPRKIAHVVFNSADRSGAFFVDQLGFKVIDQSKTITFLNCNSDHHSLALYISNRGSSFNHLAFEVPDIDSVMSATGSMVEKGEPIGWGVGRHGPCDNVFCYFVAPGGFVLEYTAEVEQVDDNYQFRGPEEWNFRPGRRDQWGLALPTERMRDPQTKVPFSTDLFTN